MQAPKDTLKFKPFNSPLLEVSSSRCSKHVSRPSHGQYFTTITVYAGRIPWAEQGFDPGIPDIVNWEVKAKNFT